MWRSVRVCPTLVRYNLQILVYEPGQPLHLLLIDFELEALTVFNHILIHVAKDSNFLIKYYNEY